jgi:hypothetical protein
MPELTALYLEMSGDSTVVGFIGEDDLEIQLDMGSVLNGHIVAENASFDVTMNSTLALSGSCKEVTIQATSGSEVDLENFQVNDATVISKGSSHVTVDPRHQLNAEADNSSSINR